MSAGSIELILGNSCLCFVRLVGIVGGLLFFLAMSLKSCLGHGEAIWIWSVSAEASLISQFSVYIMFNARNVPQHPGNLLVGTITARSVWVLSRANTSLSDTHIRSGWYKSCGTHMTKLYQQSDTTLAIKIFRRFLGDSPDPTALHASMFMDTLARQGTAEQKHKWIPLAETFGLLGTYAQTELGHGKVGSNHHLSQTWVQCERVIS